MPTRNRQRFLRQALRCFLRQTYPNRELIVVDDGDRPAAALCQGLPGVRYLRLGTRTPVGTKMNIGIEEARGRIIHKLDDDDFYSAGFLSTSVAHLPVSRRSRTLVTRCCFLVLLRGDTCPRHSGHGWNPGGAFCFWRDLWERHHFRAAMQSEDTWFLRDHDPELVRICKTEEYMVVRHGSNTWNRMTTGDTDDYFRKRPRYGKSLEEIVPAEDLPFYLRPKHLLGPRHRT
jgi:glycosyltransferase involved in cell wall biosynthesis